MPVAVILEWYGPFSSVEKLRRFSKEWWRPGDKLLYFATKKHNIVSYIGITQAAAGRFNTHHVLNEPINTKFYLGEISTQGITGKREKKRPPDLDLAERTLIWYFQPELNTIHKKYPPTDCVSIYSRFWDDDSIHEPITASKFPKLIAFNSYTEEFE